jgi:CDP-paratose 2-epimerase
MAKHYWNQSLKYIGYGGMGKQVRDMLHIDDLVDLISTQIHHIEKFKGKVFNAGGGTDSSASLLEMTALCEEITGNKIKIDAELQNRPADLRIYITNNTRIEKEIGWQPQRNVKHILSDIFKWININETKLVSILK